MAENNEGVLTMCVTNGMFVIGKLVSGGPKLLQPRVFDMYQEPARDPAGNPIIENGKPKMNDTIRMQPLPGLPPFCYVGTETLKYPITTNLMNLMSLYKQVTTPIEEKPKEVSNIVLPGSRFKMPSGMEQN